jgi:L-ascorbate metabolism protein UlaG (beta-lactamase superfamily)
MEHVIEIPAAEPVVPEVPDDSIHFIGNATMLVRLGGFTILTDPTFVHRHEKVPIGYGLTTTRLTDPAMEITDLPAVDFVLLSHFHGDHFDEVAQQHLDKELTVVTTPQACGDLAEVGFTATVGLDTWDTATMVKGGRRLTITACPGRHGPGVADFALPDVMGSIVETDDEAPNRRRLYISGDTLVFDDLAEIPRRFPALDVAVLHLGGTKVMGLLVTMDAAQGVEALELIDAGTTIPVHYDDYDVFTSSLEDFLEAAQRQGQRERVHVLRRGETFAFASRDYQT